MTAAQGESISTRQRGGAGVVRKRREFHEKCSDVLVPVVTLTSSSVLALSATDAN
jgi:hypothetical protein